MKSVFSLCLICEWQQDFIQRKSHSTPGFFPETTEPVSVIHMVSLQGLQCCRKKEWPKGTGKKDTLAAAITEQTQERGWAGCIVHWGWGQGSAGWAQAGHSGLAPPHPSSLPTAVNLTWRSLTFTELERPETNGGEENRMGSEVHRVWLPRYILSAKWSTLWVPFKTLWYSTQGPYFVLNQNNRLP